MNNKELKLAQQKADYSRTYCRCGHSITFKPKTDKAVCSWCGKTVKNTTRGHFIYKLGMLLWRQ